MAWLTGWNYRKAVTVSNTGSTLSDYQVLTTIDTATLVTAGKMRTDCGDIRLTNDDGSTLLPYWIESDCNTASTKIWVKIPSVPTSKTIYIYYGNSSATSISNGANTFLQWHGLETGGFHDSNIITVPFVYEASVTYSGSNHNIVMGLGYDGDCCLGTYDLRLTNVPAVDVKLWFFANNLGTVSSSYISPLSLDVPHRLKIIAVSTSNVYAYGDSTQVPTLTTGIPTGAMGLMKYNAVGSATQHFAFVRKYASPEPTITIETEQTPSNITATSMTITPSETPCRVGICTVSVTVTWTNTGGSSGDFIPNITIDGTPYSSPYPLQSLGSGLSDTKTFVISGLAVDTHSICPYPN